jgi:CCDC81-like prokaryotic HU domain 1/CCDC81-like prokaryotic HU domain 2/SPOR domain
LFREHYCTVQKNKRVCFFSLATFEHQTMENPVNVAHYISELLFLHDCVVVPGFGGFVCTYAPARIHPAQHTFHPPSKLLVFNRHLQQNDGLLAHAIAAAVPCRFEEAMAAIERFTAATTAALNAGKAVTLHNIGQLSLDPERNIRFEADQEVNFLIDAFGLGSFQSMPVIREAAAEKPVAEPVRELRPRENKVNATTQLPVARRPLVTRRRVIAAAILIPLAAVALWLPMQRLNNAQLAGFGWTDDTTTARYLPVNWFHQMQPAADSFPLPGNLRSDTARVISLRIGEGQPLTINRELAVPESTRVETPQRPQTAAVQPTVSGTFYVIGGAFSVSENADNYRRLLEAKGYPTAVLENIKSKLTHISIASFTNRTEAEEFLKTIQSSVPGAWILKK